MRAVVSLEKGPPESLRLVEMEDPVPGPGEVLVRVTAAALNFFDTLIIEDRYQFRPERPFSPSAEFAGTVLALGAGVAGVSPGDRVAAYVGWGACRTHLVVPADRLVRVPDGLSDDVAAGLMVTYGTSFHALKDRAKLGAGETLVVLGAAGGVGLAAVEIGRLMGARVIACASSADKLAIARQAGAAETIDYSTTDLRETLKQLTGPRGVDVVYDPVGGDLAEPALRSLGWKGRFLVVGFAGGGIPKIPLNLVLLKGCDVLGVFWGAFTEKEPLTHRANVAAIFDWAAKGELSGRVHAVYPMERIAEALQVLARREATGKVVIRP